MEIQKAKQLAANYINDESVKTLVVTSDNGVYVNNDVEAMQKHCDENRLTMIVLKDDSELAHESSEDEIGDEQPDKPKRGRKPKV